MRTTIDIDDYLLQLLRQQAHTQGVPFKEVVNRALHRGLDETPAEPRVPYRCPTFSMGAPVARPHG
jgi:hypothetical protein